MQSYPHSDLLWGVKPTPDELQVTEENNYTKEGEVAGHSDDSWRHREIIQEVSVVIEKLKMNLYYLLTI